MDPWNGASQVVTAGHAPRPADLACSGQLIPSPPLCPGLGLSSHSPSCPIAAGGAQWGQ
jgi:hypothetical protein